jgi:formylglycine-generating enzyme required for sulfatase activity
MTDVFVSYKHEDRDYASAIVNMLEREGFSVWWDERITPRTEWDTAIDRAIESAACVLVLWSERSVGSKWVKTEAHFASDRGRLVPIKIEPCELPLAFVLNQHLDLSGWRFEADDRRWRRLVAWIGDYRKNAALPEKRTGAPQAPAGGDHLQVGIFADGTPIIDGEFVTPATPAGTLFRDAAGLPVMRIVQAGGCLVGGVPHDPARQAVEAPQRSITIARPLAISAYPVTGAEFTNLIAAPAKVSAPPVRKRFFGRAEPAHAVTMEVLPDRPMTRVSATDALAFCREASGRTGRCYRLPTEAEWEYACRAGSQDVFHEGSDLCEEQACFARPSGAGPLPPGAFPANAFGLFDMQGNIREWTEDYWHESLAGLPGDGRARTDGHSAMRVTRGGAWSDPKSALRCSARGRAAEATRSDLIGFRVVREL